MEVSETMDRLSILCARTVLLVSLLGPMGFVRPVHATEQEQAKKAQDSLNESQTSRGKSNPTNVYTVIYDLETSRLYSCTEGSKHSLSGCAGKHEDLRQQEKRPENSQFLFIVDNVNPFLYNVRISADSKDLQIPGQQPIIITGILESAIKKGEIAKQEAAGETPAIATTPAGQATSSPTPPANPPGGEENPGGAAPPSSQADPYSTNQLSEPAKKIADEIEGEGLKGRDITEKIAKLKVLLKSKLPSLNVEDTDTLLSDLAQYITEFRLNLPSKTQSKLDGLLTSDVQPGTVREYEALNVANTIAGLLTKRQEEIKVFYDHVQNFTFALKQFGVDFSQLNFASQLERDIALVIVREHINKAELIQTTDRAARDRGFSPDVSFVATGVKAFEGFTGAFDNLDEAFFQLKQTAIYRNPDSIPGGSAVVQNLARKFDAQKRLYDETVPEKNKLIQSWQNAQLLRQRIVDSTFQARDQVRTLKNDEMLYKLSFTEAVFAIPGVPLPSRPSDREVMTVAVTQRYRPLFAAGFIFSKLVDPQYDFEEVTVDNVTTKYIRRNRKDQWKRDLGAMVHFPLPRLFPDSERRYNFLPALTFGATGINDDTTQVLFGLTGIYGSKQRLSATAGLAIGRVNDLKRASVGDATTATNISDVTQRITKQELFFSITYNL